MTAAILPLPAQAYVYVIGADDGPQKIGITNDPKYRRKIFQTGNHALLKITTALPVSREEATTVELYAHWLLDSRRVRGEWFDVSPDDAQRIVEDAITAVREGKTAPSFRLPKITSGGLTIRFDPDVKAAIEKAAKADKRSASSLVEIATIKYLRELGYLQE